MEAWLKCKYMREHLGEEYSGVVSAPPASAFCDPGRMYVEGLVHITELGGEYFKFDRADKSCVVSAPAFLCHRHARACAGQPYVDLDGRKIDFRLVRTGGTARAGTQGTKA